MSRADGRQTADGGPPTAESEVETVPSSAVG